MGRGGALLPERAQAVPDRRDAQRRQQAEPGGIQQRILGVGLFDDAGQAAGDHGGHAPLGQHAGILVGQHGERHQPFRLVAAAPAGVATAPGDGRQFDLPGAAGEQLGGQVLVGVPGQEERLLGRQLAPLAHLAGQKLEQTHGLDGSRL